MSKSNEALEKVYELFIKAADGIEKGAEVAIGKAPELVDQLLTYELITSAMYIVVLTVLLTMCLRFILVMKKKDFVGDDVDVDIIALSLIVGSLCGISIVLMLPKVIKIIFAPDLYVIEYVAKLTS